MKLVGGAFSATRFVLSILRCVIGLTGMHRVAARVEHLKGAGATLRRPRGDSKNRTGDVSDVRVLIK